MTKHLRPFAAATATFLLSATLAATAEAAPANSVFYYDAARTALRGVSITQAVLDGSIYPEIDRVHPYERPGGTGSTIQPDQLAAEFLAEQARARRAKVDENRKRNREAVQEHCKRERRVTNPSDEGRCGGGLRK